MGILTRAAKGSPLTHTELDNNQTFLAERFGFGDYNDAATAVTPIVLSPDTWTPLTNDALGAFTEVSYLPDGVTSLLGAGGAIDVSELSLGSDIFVRHDFTVTPNSTNQTLEFRYTAGSAAPYTLESHLGVVDTGSGQPKKYNVLNYIYVGNADTRDNPIGVEIKLSGAGSVVNTGMVIRARNYT